MRTAYSVLVQALLFADKLISKICTHPKFYVWRTILVCAKRR
jgi:hypothetical protein